MKQLVFILVLSSLLLSKGFNNATISVDSVNTQSHEYVYNPSDLSDKLSELIWKAQDVKLLGAKVDYELFNKSFLRFVYKTKIDSGNGTMDDFDWLKTTPDWSHWSHHPDTKLDKFNILDLSINKEFELSSKIDTKLALGYKVEDKGFKAYGGTYIYSSGGGFRDLSGSFSGLGISYEEEFKSIYLGLSADMKFNDLVISAGMKYSPWVKATSLDNHHNRYFINSNEFDEIKMTEYNLSTEFLIEKNLSFVFDYSKVKYDQKMGTTTRTYYTGASEKPPGTVQKYAGAGIANSYSSVGLSLVYKF